MGTNINNIVFEAFSNSGDSKFRINKELSLKAETLDAAWKKHGTKSTNSSHLVVERNSNEAELRAQFESLIFISGTDAEHVCAKGKWRTSFISGSKNILIARIDLSELETSFSAVVGAVKIDDVPSDTICTVQELGFHPTLTCKGEFIPTTEITTIIELDGGLDPSLGECRFKLKEEPVLVTWFPGRQLPTSNPTDCKVGDTMTAAEAKAKGWATVSFKK